VDHCKDIRDFLTSRRARITPQQAGLPVYGGNRRVAGLRREEVALMAGVSVDYCTRLEWGNLSGVSEGVLDASSDCNIQSSASSTSLTKRWNYRLPGPDDVHLHR
jgi:hypothetical protein